MYGSFRDIDIQTLLEFIEQTQHSGELLIEFPAQEVSNPHFWLLYFHYGQITYAVSYNSLPLQRLQDYLRRYHLDSSLDELITSNQWFEIYPKQDNLFTPRQIPEYNALWQLLENNVVSPSEIKRLLRNIIQETVFDILSLRDGNFLLKKNCHFQPRITKIKITPLILKITQQQQQWKQLFPYIISPEQCPILTNPSELKNTINPSAYKTLTVACQGDLSLRRIARYLNKDLVTISQALYPYIQRGWLHLTSSPTVAKEETTTNAYSSTVICIGKPESINEQITLTLKQEGYTPILLNNPAEAVSRIIEEQPSLILLSLDMSNRLADQLASIIRRIPQLSQPLIIVLASFNSDPLQLAKLELLGQIEFLVSPFEPSDLSQILKAHQSVSTRNGRALLA